MNSAFEFPAQHQNCLNQCLRTKKGNNMHPPIEGLDSTFHIFLLIQKICHFVYVTVHNFLESKCIIKSESCQSKNNMFVFTFELRTAQIQWYT